MGHLILEMGQGGVVHLSGLALACSFPGLHGTGNLNREEQSWPRQVEMFASLGPAARRARQELETETVVLLAAFHATRLYSESGLVVERTAPRCLALPADSVTCPL